ncbi:hypothetical protein [Paenibacillus puerhi]|uniref:hypothetical protein n=1 Tax=Paenibacillus puerhi TaxID=2692622 RepID=UPI00135B3750|nr:hypothetical protein [Paenibacillus puerhi]
MTRNMASWVSVGLFGGLMLSIAGVLYTQMNDLFFPGIILILGMFVVCMGLLWISEVEDGPEKEGMRNKDRQREG